MTGSLVGGVGSRRWMDAMGEGWARMGLGWGPRKLHTPVAWTWRVTLVALVPHPWSTYSVGWRPSRLQVQLSASNHQLALASG